MSTGITGRGGVVHIVAARIVFLSGRVSIQRLCRRVKPCCWATLFWGYGLGQYDRRFSKCCDETHTFQFTIGAAEARILEEEQVESTSVVQVQVVRTVPQGRSSDGVGEELSSRLEDLKESLKVEMHQELTAQLRSVSQDILEELRS